MAHRLTFSAIVQKAIVRLSQVPGTDVQTYAEDRIGDMVQHKFTALFDEVFWSQFMVWQTVAVSATTGIPTTDLHAQTPNPLLQFEDIKYAFVDGTNKKIVKVPEHVNPFLRTGVRARYIEPYNLLGRIFRIFPVTTTDLILVRFRSRPALFTDTDEVDFDEEALILGAVYDYLEDDGTNPGATEKFKGMFEARVRQLKLNRAQIDHELDSRQDEVPLDWVEGW